MSSGLQVLSDSRGTIVVGLVAPDVYFMRLVDFVSASLGARCAIEIHQQLARTANVDIFLDVEAALGSEFIARGSMMRALLSQRKHVRSVTILSIEGEVQTRTTDLASMLTDKVQVVHSHTVFKARMRQAAPSTQGQFPASSRMPVAPAARSGRSVRPKAPSMRPRSRSGTNG